MRLVQADLREHGITIACAIEPGLPPVVGDAVQLQQVMLNLLRNASEAIVLVAHGSRDIAVAAQRSETRVHISIRDSGIGASEVALERMFEPFVSTKTGGLGIGLAICRSIVDAHGGRITASANPDRGLTLHVELPT